MKANNNGQSNIEASLKGLTSSDPEEVNSAIIVLYKAYFPNVSGYLLKRGLKLTDIQDIFQEGILTFLKALKAGKVNQAANVGGYFFTICKNLGAKKMAKDAKENVNSIDMKQLENIAFEEDFEEEEERNLLRLKSWELMESLGKSCADLLKKSYSENRKITAFYAELGYKNAQVARTAKYKCLKRLKEKLAKDPSAQYLLKTLFS